MGDDKPIADSTDTRHLLERKECAGPAPFVGDPAWEMGRYVWHAAIDDRGRHVAGEARLEIARRPVPLLN